MSSPNSKLTAKDTALLLWPWIFGTSSALIGYSMQNVSLPTRWITGIVLSKSALYVQNYSSMVWRRVLPTYVVDSNQTSLNITLTIALSFIGANSLTGLFAGEVYFKKHGIDSYTKAIISSLSGGQTYFRKTPNAQKKTLKKIVKLCSILGCGYGISKFLKQNPSIVKTIQSNVALNMEVLGLLLSMQIMMTNVPSLLHGLVFGWNDDMEVIPPYDFMFFSASIREFWKGWSRPIGEFLRYVAYEPLGGRSRYWLSVPAVFAINCNLHFDASENTFGDKAVSGWSKGFAVMGTTMALFMAVENKRKEYDDKLEAGAEKIKDSVYWQVFCFGLFNASMATTLYYVKDKALTVNIPNVCGSLMFGDQLM